MMRSVPGFPSRYTLYGCLTRRRWRRWVAWHSSHLTIWQYGEVGHWVSLHICPFWCLTTRRLRRWPSSPLTIWWGRSLDFPPYILFTDVWLQGDDVDGRHDIVHLWQYGEVGPWIFPHIYFLQGDDADGWNVVVYLGQYGEVGPWISLHIYPLWMPDYKKMMQMGGGMT
jgi:hypothetical protein